MPALEQLIKLMEDTLAEDDAGTPVLHGSRGHIYVYSSTKVLVTIVGENYYREKGRNPKGVEIFALGDEETVLLIPYHLTLRFLEEIGCSETQQKFFEREVLKCFGL